MKVKDELRQGSSVFVITSFRVGERQIGNFFKVFALSASIDWQILSVLVFDL